MFRAKNGLTGLALIAMGKNWFDTKRNTFLTRGSKKLTPPPVVPTFSPRPLLSVPHGGWIPRWRAWRSGPRRSGVSSLLSTPERRARWTLLTQGLCGRTAPRYWRRYTIFFSAILSETQQHRINASRASLHRHSHPVCALSDEITASFRRFGHLFVDWPHKAESKSYFPPKGTPCVHSVVSARFSLLCNWNT